MSDTSIALQGVATATLEAWLSAAQAARHKLLIGGGVVKVSYQQGEGGKAVEYTKADLPALNAYISELQAALGNVTTPTRRAIGVVFR